MPETKLPTASVRPTFESEEFWNATAEERFVLPRCDACGFVIWYPRHFCPECGHRSVTWLDASGRGEVYAFTVVRRPPRGPWAAHVPFVVAYVELEEGPRVMSNVVGIDPDDVGIGLPVKVVFEDTPEGGPKLYRFAPA